MNNNVLIHKLVSGDNLYKLAQQYKTTVDGIVAANPYLDPYKLKIGDEIMIYPGHNGLSNNALSVSEVELMNNMRSLWEQHSIWTRSLIISIIDNLKDIDSVTKRLLQNPKDIGNLFRPYYGDDVADKITNLLTEHLVIGDKLVRALKARDTVTAAVLDRAWYKNADDMAFAFASINPYYVEKDMRDMLHTHLDLVKKEVSDRLAANYPTDIDNFDRVEKQALFMADNFTDGIINQFPTKFA